MTKQVTLDGFNVYLAAANAVAHRDHGACVAIHKNASHRFPDGHKWQWLSKDALVFQHLFCPYGEREYFDTWLHTAADAGLIEHNEMQSWRVLALCFMAAMVEAGDA